MVLFSLKLWEEPLLTLNLTLDIISERKTQTKLVQGSQNTT